MPTPATPLPTPEAFWSQVAASGLVDPAVLATLRKECEALLASRGTTGEGATTAIAGWLAKKGVLTQWQARRLLRGDVGPFFIGDYRLLDRLPCEGGGRLSRARHEPSGRVVLVMQLNRSLCQQVDVWTEVVRRTTIANQSANPVLSRTWALEQAGAERIIVCEDVAGMPLADELDRLGQLSIAQAGPSMLAVARAVAELHAQGVVHGAISLDTLVREPAAAGADPRSGRVRLLQFPLAGDPHVVRQRVAIESPEGIARIGRRASFIAPELLLPGAFCDARSDVYALGCVFHALLTGAPPCWQGDAQRTLSQAAFVGPAALGPPEVPLPVATLVSYLTARVPAARYPTAAEAADAIAACFGLSGAPRPPAAVPATGAAGAAAAPAAAVPPARSATPAGPSFQSAGAPPAEVRPADVRPAAAVRPHEAAIQAATLAARRRAARLRMIGLGILGGIVAATVAAVVVQSLPRERREPKTAAKPAAAEPRTAAVDDGVATADPTAAIDEREPAPRQMPAAATADEPPAAEKPAATRPAATRAVVVDDPDLPWASPTDGGPPTLAYLPAGSQLVLLARPAEIAGDEEGRLFVRALGPRVEQAVQLLAAVCGRGFEGIEKVQAGWQAGGPDEVVGGYAAWLVDPISLPIDADAARAAWGQTTAEEIGGETIHKAVRDGKPFAYWLPVAEGGRVLVAAPEPMVRQMIAAGAAAGDDEAMRASLSKDMEALVGMLDDRRHLTLFGSPTYLLHDGRVVLAGPLAKLVDPLGRFLGDETPAAAVSLHFGDNFYAELDAIATVDVPAAKLAATLAGRVAELADAVEEYCTALDPHPYGRKLVLRLPAMLRVLAANSRAGAEGKGVVVNGYLPRHAGHNLVLAAELAVAQSPGASPVPGQPAAGPARADEAAAPQGALGRLQKKISLVFARDTLEKSIQMVAEEIGVPMDIMGGDLQLEGITKNQSFGLDERDKTADAILRTILAKSNPDGKLVYVVHVKDGVETIDITTRAAAAKRGEKLPAGFEEGQKPADKKP